MDPHTALCWKKLPDRNSSWPAIPGGRHCHKLPGHSGSCGEFGFLNNLKSIDNKIANKVKRVSWNTTGAAWKTKKAGPNRMPRYVAALPIEEFEKALKEKGFNLNELSTPEKIIEKGATYAQCINVAIKLTREA
ncbi:MAG: hypothetical protein MK168_06400, partial [Candidatus Thalassarchaeum sp.]|nr:hypothetical protein [Candidatus Thalassarchaeum sp.]